MKTILVCFIFLSVCGLCAADCSSYSDCGSCAEATTWWGMLDCYWCPLDRECHSWGSVYTPCFGDLHTTEPDKCVANNEGSYNPKDAYTNTLLSAVAYGEDIGQCIRVVDPNRTFKVETVTAVRCDNVFSEYDECVAYTAVSTDKNSITIVFRGSNSNEQVIDQVFSYLSSPAISFRGNGKVYEYFYEAYTHLYPCVKRSVKKLVRRYPGYRVVVTGHSLGGALASLTAASLVLDGITHTSNLYLYTFGMPRIGNKEFALNIDRLLTNSWNIVNYRDLVPHMPPCYLLGCNYPADGPYHHKREIYYNGNGNMKLKSPYTVCNGNEDDACGNGAIDQEPCYDVTECMKYHKKYFNTNLGKLCLKSLGSSANPKPWTELSNQCQSF